MGLILKSILSYWPSQREPASNMYILIPKNVLSIPYNVKNLSTIKGSIIKIKPIFSLNDDEEIFKKLKNIIVEFIIVNISLGSSDFLYLSKSSWEKIRDWGILPDKYELTCKLDEIWDGPEVQKIYPYQDVVVN
jgi:hypothetical protein